MGSERGGGALESREEPWKDLNFNQQQVSRLREKCIGEGSWAGSLAGLKARSHFGSVVCRDGERAVENSGAEHPIQWGG